MSRHPLIPLCFLMITLAAGCSSVDREEMELLKNDDPKFKAMMDVKEQAEKEIGNLNASLSKYNKSLSQKIQDMRAAYRKEQGRVAKRIKDYKKKLSVNKEQYSRQLESLEKALEKKRGEAVEIKGALEDVDGILSRKDTLRFSEDDMINLGQRKRLLEQQIGPLEEEIERLNMETNLTKKKLKFL